MKFKNSMSVIKKLAGETMIYGMANILPRILFFFMTLIYLTYRFPNQEDYGEYNELYAYVTIFLTILVYRLDTAYFRFGSQSVDRSRIFGAALSPVLISSIVIVAIVLINSQSIASLINYSERPHYIQWFALIIGFDAIATMFYAQFRLDSRPRKFLFFKVSNVIITIIFILIFLEVLPRIAPDTLESISSICGVTKELDYVFLANLIASGCILILLIPDFMKVHWNIDISLLKKMMIYSLPLVVVGLAGNINQAFAIPLQKYLLGDDLSQNISNAGVYAAAAKIALLLNLFTVAFNYAAEPFFFNNAKNDTDKLAYGKIALTFTIVCLIVILGLVSYSGLIKHLVGDNYRAAIYLVPILLFAYLFLGLYYNVSIWYKLSDKTLMGAFISLIGAVITLLISFIYLPKIGYAASAYAALITYVTMVILGYALGQKYYPIKYPIGKICLYIAVVGLMCIHIQYLNSHSSWRAMLIGTLYIIGFTAYVYKHDKGVLD